MLFVSQPKLKPVSQQNNKGSLTNGSRSRVAGPKSGSRVQCRGRGSNVAVAVAGPISRREGNDLGFEVTE